MHAMREVPYPAPGEILLEEFLKPMGLTQYRLAKEIGVPQRRIGEIIAGSRGITADTALRLSRFFGMNDAFWIGLQVDYDLAEASDAMRDVLSKIQPLPIAAPATRAAPRARRASSKNRSRHS
jgi:addiction module HigA family antidote